MNRILPSLVFAFMLTSCNAEDTAAAFGSASVGAIRAAWHEISQHAIALVRPTEPRKVARGAQPEIILNRAGIHINGKTIALGQTLAEWKNVIPGTPRCKTPEENDSYSCMWDQLGIYLLVYRDTVFEFNVFFYLSPWSDSESIGADGTVYPAKPDWRPKHPYTGYFEMDGYAIDAQTTFDDISGNVDPDRGLRCGRFEDCGRIYGGHFDAKTRMVLTLTRNDSRGKIEEFSIYAGRTDFLTPTPPEECTPDSTEAKMDHCAPLPSITSPVEVKR